jgi:hypothetical protein
MITGYSADLPSDVLLDSGVLYVGSNIMGVSRGGLQFDPGKEYKQVTFDGYRGPIKGLDRIASYNSKITGTLLELGTEERPWLEPGSTSDGASPIDTTTMKAAGVFLVSGDYLSNVRLVYERGSGGYAAVLFTDSVLAQYSVKGNDGDCAEIAITIEARIVPSGTNTGVCPYKIELRTALP